MRYLALATDYDNTLAEHGRVDAPVRAALVRLRESGRRVVLLTGRRLEDLSTVCDCLDCFDYVVAENGAVAYEPTSRKIATLARPLPGHFVAALESRGVEPLEVGRVIVATQAPHEASVIEAVREAGLDVHVVFNREAIMVLPAGITKASGMKHALRSLGLSPHEVVGIGDAENDHSFLQLVECPVAVANAVDSVKQSAALVTEGRAGAGVIELIDALVANDLAHLEARLARRHVAPGT